ncbi:hypothetical protein AAC387_Pa05g3870 [Persea americana]
MGTIFGKIGVETPKYQVLHTSPDYEIRKYSPSIVAQVTYDPAQLRGNRDGGFSILANYIGALGQPQNKKPEKIAMTAPVITQSLDSTAEKIAMTAPVITESTGVAKEDGKKEKMVTMQFVLPDKYKRVEEAPLPVDERVVEERVEKLKRSLERDGYKVVGQFLLGRYNPPWTLPAFRTNEIMIPIE